MVAIGSEVVVLSAGAFNLENTTAMNVLDFGAKNTGDPADAATNLTAFNNAFNALPANGGVLVAPSGTYAFAASLVFKDKPVLLLGDWGRDQEYSSGDLIRCATIIKSSFNGVCVNFTSTNKTTIGGLGSAIQNLGILCTGSGASQVGLRIDNRGSRISNVEVAGAGLDGIQIADCVNGLFDGVSSFRNTRHGWFFDPTLGSGTLPAVTNNTSLNCTGNSNTQNGIRLRDTAWGNVFVGSLYSSNTGYGIFMLSNGGNSPRFNRFYGTWDELNTAGSVRIDDASVADNIIDFTRYSSGAASIVGFGHNSIQGSNIGLVAANAQRPVTQLVDVQSSPLTGADLDAIRLRNRDDSDDGSVRLRSVVSDFGIGVSAGVTTDTLAVPQGVDAFCTTNGHGLTSRNTANSLNQQLIAYSTVINDVTTVDGALGVMVGKTGSRFGVCGATPVVRDTGWAAATNTKTKTTFDTTTVTLPVLAAHVGAIIDVLIANGQIGA